MKRVLAGAALLLGLAAAVVGATPAPRWVSAPELAREIRARRPGLVVVDARDAAAFNTDSIPTALNIAPDRASGAMAIYAASDAEAVRAARRVTAKGAEVRIVAGGLDAWRREVVRPRLPDDPRAWSKADAERADLSAYFGGGPRASSDPEPPTGPSVRRRGC